MGRLSEFNNLFQKIKEQRKERDVPVIPHYDKCNVRKYDKIYRMDRVPRPLLKKIYERMDEGFSIGEVSRVYNVEITVIQNLMAKREKELENKRSLNGNGKIG